MSSCKVDFEGTTLYCAVGTNLRDLLISQGLNPYTDDNKTQMAGCRGNARCLKCCLFVDGKSNKPTSVEQVRLGAHAGRVRLACRLIVKGNITAKRIPPPERSHHTF